MNCIELRDEKLWVIEQKVEKLRKKYEIAVITVGDDPASQVYVGHKKKMIEKVGLVCGHYEFEFEDWGKTGGKVTELIRELNGNDDVAGIILQLPLPNASKVFTQFLVDQIDESKDIDRLTTKAKFQWMTEDDAMLPATAQGVYDLLWSNHLVEDHKISIVGRSDLVGLPLYHALTRDRDYDCMTKLVHTGIDEQTKNWRIVSADVIVTATGNPNAIDSRLLKSHHNIIDVGIIRGEDGKLRGDILEADKEKCNWFTPVPKGVGILTVVCLIENAIKLIERKEGVVYNV